MARFLITAWSATGHINTALAIAKGVRDRGHEVAVYNAEAARAKVEGEGLRFFPYEGIDMSRAEQYFATRNSYTSWTRPWEFRSVFSFIVDSIPGQVNDVSRIIEEWKPDVVVSDVLMWGPTLIVRELQPVPVAIFSSVLACPRLRPEEDRDQHGSAWHRTKTRVQQALFNLVREHLLAKKARQAVNACRESFGLAPMSGRINNHFVEAIPLYMVAGMRELDFERNDLPDSVHYVGPCVWNKQSTAEPPAWLAEIPTDQPWVHVTEGTVTGRHSVLLHAAAEGLAGLPIQVIMTTCGREPVELHLGSVAPNIHVASWVPQSDIVANTSLFVTTGGAGSVMAALCEGIPHIVVPTEADKPFNAKLVEHAGMGVAIAPRKCTAQRLRKEVMRVLEEPSFRVNARRMADIAAGYRGPDRAAELLESLLPGATASGDTP